MQVPSGCPDQCLCRNRPILSLQLNVLRVSILYDIRSVTLHTAGSGQPRAGSRQRGVDSGQRAADSGQPRADSRQRGVDSRQQAACS